MSLKNQKVPEIDRSTSRIPMRRMNDEEPETENDIKISPLEVEKNSSSISIGSILTSPSSALKILCLIIILALSSVLISIPLRKVETVQVIQIPQYQYQFPDITTVKGKYKEAYGLQLCTRGGAGHDDQMNFNALQVSIHRLKDIIEKEETKKDIIVVVCQHTPFWQYVHLKNLDIIVIPVMTINPPQKAAYERWIDNFTKLQFIRLLGWERVLLLDIDLYFKESFTSVWDEPASQIRYELEDKSWEGKQYYGVNVSDLYPYVFAACIDTSNWARWKKEDKLNSGFFIVKPNIHHFHMVMNMAYDKSLLFDEMEQTLLSVAYSRKLGSPVPWTQLNESYNYFGDADENPAYDYIKVYHVKFWKPETKWPRYGDTPTIWKDTLWLALDEYKQATIPPTFEIISSANSVTMTNLTISLPGKAKFYAIASQDLEKVPSFEDIKQRFSISGVYSPGGASELTDGPANLEINGLEASTTYHVYYFAETDIKFSKLTTIEYVRIITKKNKTELRP